MPQGFEPQAELGRIRRPTTHGRAAHVRAALSAEKVSATPRRSLAVIPVSLSPNPGMAPEGLVPAGGKVVGGVRVGDGATVAAGGGRSWARAGSASTTAAEIIKNRLLRTLAHIRFNGARRNFLRLCGKQNQAAYDEHQGQENIIATSAFR